MTTIHGTTRTTETHLPAIGAMLRITSSMAEDGTFIDGIDVSHNECANIEPGIYRIVKAEYGAHFSSPGFSGYHVAIGLEATDLEDAPCLNW